MFLNFFYPQKVEETTSKSCLLKQKFRRFINFSFTAQMAEFMFQNVAYRATVYRTGVIDVESQIYALFDNSFESQ